MGKEIPLYEQDSVHGTTSIQSEQLTQESKDTAKRKKHLPWLVSNIKNKENTLKIHVFQNNDKYIFFMMQLKRLASDLLKQHTFAGNINHKIRSQLLLLDSNSFQINQSKVRDLSMNSIFHRNLPRQRSHAIQMNCIQLYND